MATTLFRKQKEDGSEEPIPEEELYQYTRYRWLCNEHENLALRYRKFNISALLDAAVDAVGNGARSCKNTGAGSDPEAAERFYLIPVIFGVKLLKCIEGQYNKAFILTLDNGVEVLAKIPNPNAGPHFYTTASEVATRYFLRTVLNLPVPRIYSYSFDLDNPVGAEYVIEEKAEGKPLGSLWYKWKTASRLDLVTQLVDFETKLASVTFRRHGCIYFKQDLEEKGIPACEMESSFLHDNSVGMPLTEVLALGPLTEARLWEGERATMHLDRGPWGSPPSYLVAMGINEMRWAKAHARPRINPYRSLETPEAPTEYISLLERYLQLVPYLSPGVSRTSLSHPDLHLDNIFVDPNTKQITCIIDWQSASVSEPFFQQSVPRLLLPTESASTSNKLEAEPEYPCAADEADRAGDLLKHYRLLSRLNEQRSVATDTHRRSLLIKPVSLLYGAWSRNDVISFRHALIHVVAQWEKSAPATVPCPISFTDEELELHNSEMELVEGLGEVLHQLQNDNLIPLGGMVLRENYEQALLVNNAVKEMFVNMAESESQKNLYSRVWPYQDQGS